MLHRPGRSMTPDAIRARRNRARRKAGLVNLRVWLPRRQLIAAMRCANPDVGELATKAEIEAELQAVDDAFIVRWVGPPKK